MRTIQAFFLFLNVQLPSGIHRSSHTEVSFNQRCRSFLADGTHHWKRAGASGKGLDSLEIEMTSYVLLALLSGPEMQDFNLDYSTSIVRWLTQQQNPYGGFSSTQVGWTSHTDKRGLVGILKASLNFSNFSASQDTVVALQALAKYGAIAYSPGGRSAVTVTSLGGLNREFTVDDRNRLLYQEERLSEVPGEYTIRAEGQSCVLAQV